MPLATLEGDIGTFETYRQRVVETGVVDAPFGALEDLHERLTIERGSAG